MKLADLTRGRDNNFNLIRIVAAVAVLVSHSFALAVGTSGAEPLRNSLGMSLGEIAVDVFFVVSGFLVTGSLLTGKNTAEFVRARVLRIYPALLVTVFFTVFVLGPAFTTAPLSLYFADPRTYLYLLKNSNLITGTALNLPGVFEANPYKSVVNGSLWTLPHELRLYALLALIWAAAGPFPKLRLRFFNLTIVGLAALACVWYVAAYSYFPRQREVADMFLMFFSGAALYVLRHYVVLSTPIFCLSIVSLLMSTTDKEIFSIVYHLTIGYLVLFIAFVPSGRLRDFNRLGDYSYGIYILAFPVQQSIVALIPGISILSGLFLSATVTFLLAALSWHCVERHALKLKALDALPIRPAPWSWPGKHIDSDALR